MMKLKKIILIITDFYSRILENKKFIIFNDIITEMKSKKINFGRSSMLDDHDLDLVNFKIKTNEKIKMRYHKKNK